MHKVTLRQAVYTVFQLEVRDDRAQVGIPAALAVAVEGALNVRRAGLHGNQRVSHGKLGIVVRVDANPGLGESLSDRVHGLRKHVGQRAAICVAQHQRDRPGRRRRLKRGKGVRRIGPESVEEMFRVIDHAKALCPQIADRIGDHGQVFVQGRL